MKVFRDKVPHVITEIASGLKFHLNQLSFAWFARMVKEKPQDGVRTKVFINKA